MRYVTIGIGTPPHHPPMKVATKKKIVPIKISYKSKEDNTSATNDTRNNTDGNKNFALQRLVKNNKTIATIVKVG